MKSYMITPDGDLIRISDDIDPAALAVYVGRRDAAEADVGPMRERLDALVHAMTEGWCPRRSIENEIDHLNDVLDAHYVAKYPSETRQTLQDAETDLAAWNALSHEARDERWNAHDRDESERIASRHAEAQLRQRHGAFYAAMKQANVSPPRWIDNDIANWSIAS